MGQVPLRLWWVIASAVLMVVGAIGPWATVLFISVSGLDGGDGWFVLVAGIVVLAISAVHWRHRSGVAYRPWWPFAVGLVAAAIAAATAIYDVVDIESLADEEFGIVSVGWGLWMSVVASASATVALVAALLGRNEGVDPAAVAAAAAVSATPALAPIERAGQKAADGVDHPIRLVVTADLERSRLTVFFRLLLAIPHLFVLALWSTVAFVIAVINWFATLVKGQSPQGLHDFLANYLRYATQVEAYLLLAGNPFPPFFVGSKMSGYPVDLEIAAPAPQSRWKTLFRLVLSLPTLLLAAALLGGPIAWASTYGGGLADVAAFLLWFAILVRGRAARGLRDAAAWGIGYGAQAGAYLFLLTDRYPYTGPKAHLAGLEPPEVSERVPRLVNDDDFRRSRLTVLLRLPLAFPHLVWLILWTVAAVLASIANWFSALAIGRAPRPLARFLSAYIRYTAHVGAFLYVAGNPFPGFLGAAGSYPLDVRIDPFARQSRWITLFRLPLMVPAALVSGAAGGIGVFAAFLGWFVALVRGRMPDGLQAAIAYSLGYSAQFYAYAFVLTDRYPHSSPQAVFVRPEPARLTLESEGPGAFV